ncbi:unnamed protein product [Prorocentrum cordatum]|uniref:Apple domain-containing protein n=1 Tax=Prorocentrum cordatum TaxID=2364126 RepID=A0ABN9VFD5_9DINO|nr:unnamed protein product [Polarella glacialis]
MRWAALATERSAPCRAGYSPANATDSGGDVESELAAEPREEEERRREVCCPVPLPPRPVTSMVVASLVIACYVAHRTATAGPPIAAARAGLDAAGIITEQEGPRCGDVAQDYDLPGNDIAWHEGVESAEGCCWVCAGAGGCEAWAHDATSRRCFLKGGMPFAMMSGLRHDGWSAGSVVRPLVTNAGAPAPLVAPLTAAESRRSFLISPGAPLAPPPNRATSSRGCSAPSGSC